MPAIKHKLCKRVGKFKRSNPATSGYAWDLGVLDHQLAVQLRTSGCAGLFLLRN